MQAMVLKKLLVNAAISALLAGIVNGAANAIPVIDVVDPDPDAEINNLYPEYTFTHDITDGVAPGNFVPGSDIIDTATISISLTDSGGSESIEITIDELLATTIDNIGSSGSYTAVIPSIADLQLDGQLLVQLTTASRRSGIGDFFFASSTLTAEVIKGNPDANPPGPNQVPEPSVLALLSLGLVGIGVSRREDSAK
jgi:hypothetical protein